MLSKEALDLGVCLHLYTSELDKIHPRHRRVKDTTVNDVTISVLKRVDGRYDVTLRYGDEKARAFLKPSELCSPSNWESALRKRPRLMEFVKCIKFIDHDTSLIPFDKFVTPMPTADVTDDWRDYSDRLSLAASAAKHIMRMIEAFDEHHGYRNDWDVGWVTPMLNLRTRDANSISLTHYSSVSTPYPEPVLVVFGTSNRELWKGCLVNIFLDWLTTPKWVKFVSLFETRIYCRGTEARSLVQKEISMRYKTMMDINIPLWMCNAGNYDGNSLPDVIAFTTSTGKVSLIPLTLQFNHAPIFTRDDVNGYAQEYVKAMWL